MKIGITSVGTATSVGVIKNIRKYDSRIEIIGTDINEYGYTAGSLMVDKFYKVSLAKNASFMDEVIEIIEKENVEIFIPINDIEIEVFAQNRDRWSGKCTCMIPSIEVIELLKDKLVCTKKMETLGLACPEIVDVDYKGKKIVRDRVGVGSKGIQILEDGIGISDIREDQFIQKFAEGDEYTVDILCDWEGSPMYIIPRQRLEVKSGVATKSKIVNDDEMISRVQKVLQEVKLPGFSNFQFICDHANKWFIEINPRIGGGSSASLLAAEGMFPCFVELLKGNNVSNCHFEENQAGVKWDAIVTRYYEEKIYEG